ncbi:sensor histidine kinase [Actinopolymorpha pittospori]
MSTTSTDGRPGRWSAPTWWRRPDRWRLVEDVGIGVLLGAATVVEALTRRGTPHSAFPLTWTLVLGLLAVAVAVPLRRTYPVVAMLLAAAAGTWVAGYALAVVTTYSVGYRVRRASVTVAAVVAAGVIPTTISWYTVDRFLGPEYDLVLIVAVVTFVHTAAAMFGRYRRQRVTLVAAGWERAERLERERALLVDQARLRERARIAQDMHDSLGHELSLIALQAGALELDRALSDRQRETARLLRTTTGDAVTHLRQIVGVLRDADEPAPTRPAVESIAALVDRAVSSGVDVRLEREEGRAGLGDGSGPAGSRADGKAVVEDAAPDVLPVLTSQAAYRVVQEGLTNATKHAPGAPVRVRLRDDDDLVTVTVTNDAPAGSSPGSPGSHRPGASGGRGLVGLAERVRVAGGRLSAGPHRGGFRITAQLPRRGEVVRTEHDLDDEEFDAARRVGGAREASAGVLRHRQDGLGGLSPFVPPADELSRLDGYTSAVARLRRRFWIRLVVPLVTLALLAAGYLTYFGFNQAMMTAQQFASLRVGESEAAVRARLPAGTNRSLGRAVRMPAPPAGSTCLFYLRRLPGLINYDDREAYRVCYADGRLASREVVRFADRR